MTETTPPEPDNRRKAHPECYLVFTAAGDLCRAHIGHNVSILAYNHAMVIKGIAVQVPVVADFRNT